MPDISLDEVLAPLLARCPILTVEYRPVNNPEVMGYLASSFEGNVSASGLTPGDAIRSLLGMIESFPFHCFRPVNAPPPIPFADPVTEAVFGYAKALGDMAPLRKIIQEEVKAALNNAFKTALKDGSK